MSADRDGNRSNPYRPDPAQCCEACVFGSGEHAEHCKGYKACSFCCTVGHSLTECAVPLELHTKRPKALRASAQK